MRVIRHYQQIVSNIIGAEVLQWAQHFLGAEGVAGEVEEFAAVELGSRLCDATVLEVLFFDGDFSDSEVESPLIGHGTHLMQMVHVAENALDV